MFHEPFSWQTFKTGFLGRLLGPLLKVGLSLMKNVVTPLAKSVLIPLRLTAAAADAGILKKIVNSEMKRFPIKKLKIL